MFDAPHIGIDIGAESHVTATPLVRITPLALGTRLTLKAGCTLIEDDGEHILVDPGCFASRERLDEALQASAGIGLADVAIVFFTHLHFDHYRDLGFAEVARVLMPRTEVDAARRLAALRGHTAAYVAHIEATHERISPVFMRQFLRLVDDPRYDFDGVSFRQQLELIGPGDRPTPNTRVIDLAGHSVGQVGLAMHTVHGRTVVAGDAALSAEDMGLPDIGHHLVVHDGPALMRTRQRLREFDCVVPGHGAWFNPRTGRSLPAHQESSHV